MNKGFQITQPQGVSRVLSEVKEERKKKKEKREEEEERTMDSEKCRLFKKDLRVAEQDEPGPVTALLVAPVPSLPLLPPEDRSGSEVQAFTGTSLA